MGLGEGEVAAFMTGPPRTTWFQSCPNSHARQSPPAGAPSGQREAGYTTHLAAHDRRPLNKRRLSLLPLRTAPVVGCVISFAAAALKLLLWGGAHHSKVSLATSNIPGCVATIPLCGQSVDSDCTAGVLSGRRTSPPKLANPRARVESALSPLLAPRYRHKKVRC